MRNKKISGLHITNSEWVRFTLRKIPVGQDCFEVDGLPYSLMVTVPWDPRCVGNTCRMICAIVHLTSINAVNTRNVVMMANYCFIIFSY